ncbi:MAG TPA: hypothetical protein O0X23_05215 [Methanocorpusculum sp.]|nr:hypothetical protein [Methanocorpusculum sp.]
MRPYYMMVIKEITDFVPLYLPGPLVLDTVPGYIYGLRARLEGAAMVGGPAGL